jgi:hypothetical protein
MDMNTDKAAWTTIQRALAGVPLMRRRRVVGMLKEKAAPIALESAELCE